MITGKTIISPYEASEIVLIRAVTNLHPGVGRAGEVIDLPVQKDNFGFPIIYSSSLKGALKSAFWQHSDIDKYVIKALFGPEPEDEKFVSAVAILDALLVAFPVRSLEGVYAFATSPLLLKRFSEYLKITGTSYDYIERLSNLSIGNDMCEISKKAEDLLKIKIGTQDFLIINEEITVRYRTEYSSEIEKLENFFGVEQGRLILINDNDAQRALERSLVRVTRIAVDRESKTVKEGALWTEEYVPWNTLYATVFLYSKTRKNENILQKVNDIERRLHELLERTGNYLIIGGNETIGRGIVKLEFRRKEEEGR